MTPILLLPAAAGSSAAASAGGGASFLVMAFPYIAIFAIFYFLLIRPQTRRIKETKAMIDAVARGDRVVTAGGIVGRVTRVDDDEVEVEIAAGVKVKVVKATLTGVTSTAPKPAND